MAATAGSTYQVIRTQHIAGNPPGTDPQRATETLADYKARMAALGFPPDINATESDAEYLVRLATYVSAPPLENISASYALYAGTEVMPEASSSWATTSSFALTTLTTIQVAYISESYASASTSASYSPVEPAYSASVSTFIGTKQNSLVTANTYTITSSWSAKSTSASYAPVEPGYSASAATFIGTKQNALVTGNTYTITSSWTNNAVTASSLNSPAGVSTTLILQSSSMAYFTASFLGGLLIGIAA